MERERVTQLKNPAEALSALNALRDQEFFDHFAEAPLRKLVYRSDLVRLEPGEMLMREGEIGAQEMYILLTGVLNVESSARLILRLERAGELVGELAVLHKRPRIADVVAESSATLLAIRPEVVALPEFADVAAIFYMMLAHSVSRKLAATTSRSQQQLDQVSREAATDRLTGLANRRRLDEFLAAVRRSEQPFSLVMLDVDHFKNYNDNNGHLLGDMVLTKLGLILQSHIRSGDLAARYGGEEFVVVLPNCDIQNATRIAEQLRVAIDGEPLPNAERQPLGRLTATFGVACHRDNETVSEVLHRADESLYRGKARGRNQVVVAV